MPDASRLTTHCFRGTDNWTTTGAFCDDCAQGPYEPADELVSLLGPVVAAQGYDLEDVTVVAAGRRSVIRVVIDSDTGVDLDAVASVARAVSEALDDESSGGAAFAGPYVLEVSSPGTDRVLSEQRHWRRAVGRLVTTSAADRPITGRVTAVTSERITIHTGGTDSEFLLAELSPGRIELEFSRPGDGPHDGSDDFDDAAEEDDFADSDAEDDASAAAPVDAQHGKD